MDYRTDKIKELEKRKRELEQEMKEFRGWGAFMTEAREEIKEIDREISRIRKGKE